MDRTTTGTLASSPIATTADLVFERWRSLDELVTALVRETGEPAHFVRHLLRDLCLDAVRPMRIDDGNGGRRFIRDVRDRSVEAILDLRLADAEERRRAPSELRRIADETLVEWPVSSLVVWMVRVGLGDEVPGAWRERRSERVTESGHDRWLDFEMTVRT